MTTVLKVWGNVRNRSASSLLGFGMFLYIEKMTMAMHGVYSFLALFLAVFDLKDK